MKLAFRHALIAVLLTLCHSAFGQQVLPEGYSEWRYRGKCDADCRSRKLIPGYTNIWILRKGDRICGYVDQDYGFGAEKSPGGRLVGHKSDGGFEIEYADSFSDPETPGSARLSLQGNSLQFSHESGAPKGYLYLSNMLFQIKRPRKALPSTEQYQDCLKFNGDNSDFLRRYP
jgi:hypothetical protein